jgi:DNA-binding transcriptional ArsR family regulator
MQLDVEKMRERAGRASQLLAAMANEKRLLILCQLVDGEHSVGELAEFLGARQSTISQHLALLKKDGFVESRRDGQTQYYSLAGHEARSVLEALYGVYCAPVRKKR